MGTVTLSFLISRNQGVQGEMMGGHKQEAEVMLVKVFCRQTRTILAVDLPQIRSRHSIADSLRWVQKATGEMTGNVLGNLGIVRRKRTIASHRGEVGDGKGDDVILANHVHPQDGKVIVQSREHHAVQYLRWH